MTAPTARGTIARMHTALPGSIERTRKLAKDAIDQYTAELKSGEPVYPAWADDVLNVCMAADIYNCEQVLFEARQRHARAQR